MDPTEFYINSWENVTINRIKFLMNIEGSRLKLIVSANLHRSSKK